MTRRGAGWPSERTLHPEQAISLVRALRAACLDGPRSAHIADQGHLGVGARADFLVLPGAAFEAADEASSTGASAELLNELRPLATVLDGKTVWRSPDFDP